MYIERITYTINISYDKLLDSLAIESLFRRKSNKIILLN